VAGRLDGVTAIVTGSDSGIGQAIAVHFAREGADVMVTYLSDREGAEETRKEIEWAGRRAAVTQLDQRREEQVARLFQETREVLGLPYVLVNNAAVDYSGTPAAEMESEVWDRAIKTNLYGPFFCCQHFIRARREAGGRGKIINISSVHEDIPLRGGAEYDSAKGGLRMLTRTLALELAPEHINVNSIAPGMILTPMQEEVLRDPERLKRQVESIPWKRAGEPWEVARLALYLASEEADYVTGQTFVIDGGMTVAQR